ncbi:hypothetical protein SAMD00023353_6100260 [Rosellinia necatrix]|uniref:Uncharacterized protein n=1 Tax=Rosellinia necatrix TaxID=77044 RepID=A0A1S8AAL2_ROSNE|nr:hypothetical protein SAMD00023353_6100260 [Rosellinia necatrix]
MLIARRLTRVNTVACHDVVPVASRDRIGVVVTALGKGLDRFYRFRGFAEGGKATFKNGLSSDVGGGDDFLELVMELEDEHLQEIRVDDQPRSHDHNHTRLTGRSPAPLLNIAGCHHRNLSLDMEHVLTHARHQSLHSSRVPEGHVGRRRLIQLLGRQNFG